MATTEILDFFERSPTNVKRILREYDKDIYNNIFYINKQVLRDNSSYVKFNKEKWIMRPHLYAAERYGDSNQYVYPVLLTVNNIGTLYDFKPENFPMDVIVTPHLSTIFRVLSFRLRHV